MSGSHDLFIASILMMAIQVLYWFPSLDHVMTTATSIIGQRRRSGHRVISRAVSQDIVRGKNYNIFLLFRPVDTRYPLFIRMHFDQDD